jgi:hypothetical protein
MAALHSHMAAAAKLGVSWIPTTIARMLRRFALSLCVVTVGCLVRSGASERNADARIQTCLRQPEVSYAVAEASRNDIPAPSFPGDAPLSASRVGITVTIALRTDAPAARPLSMHVTHRGRLWSTPITFDAVASTRDSARFVPRDAPPLWLDSADSLDICLSLDRGGNTAIVRVPPIAVTVVS